MSNEDMAYARVTCHGDVLDGHRNRKMSCGPVDLSESQYVRQMSKPDVLWSCPNCGSTASFDDGYFEMHHGINDDEIPENDLVRDDGPFGVGA